MKIVSLMISGYSSCQIYSGFELMQKGLYQPLDMHMLLQH